MWTKKGGVTVKGVLVAFVAIVVYCALLPAMSSMLDTIVPTLDGMTRWIAQLFPLIILVTIILKTVGDNDSL